MCDYAEVIVFGRVAFSVASGHIGVWDCQSSESAPPSIHACTYVIYMRMDGGTPSRPRPLATGGRDGVCALATPRLRIGP